MNLTPQVWQTASGTWRNLSSAQLHLPYYPYLFLAPNGNIFSAGPPQTTRYLDTSGTGAWTVVGNTNYGPRNWGSAVMYDDGKVMVLGGITGDFFGGPSAMVPTAMMKLSTRRSYTDVAICGTDGFSKKTPQRCFATGWQSFGRRW